MPYTVLIPEDIAAEGKDFLIEKGYNIKPGTGLTPAQIAADAADCDAILMRTAKCPAEVIEANPQLKIIARHGVGYDNIDTDAAAKCGIWVTNTPYALSDAVAEYTLASMLLLAKNIIPCSKAEAAGDYTYKNTHKGIDLMGKTLSIIGFGRIGTALALKAQALGMRVLAHSRSLTKETVPSGVIAASWAQAWSNGDFVTLHMPCTAETKNSVTAATFDMMKDGAFFVNVARGGIVNENDLAAALKAGKPKSALIDVTEQEPTPLDSPLFKLDNAILTPHMASNTKECMARMALHAAMEIDRVLSGAAPLWPVNNPQK